MTASGPQDAVDERRASLLAELVDVEERLADPSVHADAALAKRLGRRFAELSRLRSADDDVRRLADDLGAAEELAAEDPTFVEEVDDLRARLEEARTRLHSLLVPRDPDDARDVLVEVKAGEGGEESALFAAELVRMYARWAERHGWTMTELSSTPTDLGGVKDGTWAVRARGAVAPEDGVWAHMKFEGGVHRVQRIPVTESQGRIHTSAVGVLVTPEVDEDEGEVAIDPADLRIDVFRSSGPGGQSVNTTDSAVRVTHLPTGIVVSMQNEKSQLQNKEAALRVLRSRLAAEARARREAEASAHRLSQVRTVDRSERIRTYNFPENRIADHRNGFKAFCLDQVLDGALDPVVDSLIAWDEAARLAEGGGE